MLSLETSKKLREAGFPQSFAHYDRVYYEGFMQSVIDFDHDNGNKVWITGYNIPVNISSCVFAPDLDQMLAWIEAKGYAYSLFNTLPYYRFSLSKIMGEFLDSRQIKFQADSPEEAVAQAVLWIIEQGANA